MVTSNERVFEFIAGNMALDFANTVHSVGSEDPQDDLKTYSDLLVWAEEAGLAIKGSRHSHGGERQADLARLKDLRGTIFKLFSAELHGAGPEVLAGFNLYLQSAGREARLYRAGSKYGVRSASSRTCDRLQFEITRAAVELLLSGRLQRIRQCAGENCTWLFLDTSRNGTRKWCEMQACGNRAKIRRFRKRSPS
jgi:predicted RNA-binding Zn ribbon-like protein